MDKLKCEYIGCYPPLVYNRVCTLSSAVITIHRGRVLYRKMDWPGSVLGFLCLSLGFGAFLVGVYELQFSTRMERKLGRAVAHIATLSYSLYLIHPLALGWAVGVVDAFRDTFGDATGPTAAPFMVQALVSALTVWGAGAVLYWGVERTFLNLRARLL